MIPYSMIKWREENSIPKIKIVVTKQAAVETGFGQASKSKSNSGKKLEKQRWKLIKPFYLSLTSSHQLLNKEDDEEEPTNLNSKE